MHFIIQAGFQVGFQAVFQAGFQVGFQVGFQADFQLGFQALDLWIGKKLSAILNCLTYFQRMVIQTMNKKITLLITMNYPI